MAPSQSVVNPIYPSYLQFHDLKRDPFVLELALGAEEPNHSPYTVTVQQNGKSISTTGEVWTFRIRRGLRFQDDACFAGGKGREITAADFIYCFRRMADPAVPCPIVAYFDTRILGMSKYEEHNRELEHQHRPADYRFPMDGLQLDAYDPYAFRILLNEPYPQLRFIMAMAFTSPLAHEAVDRYGKELARHPVGCGAYMMTSYKPKGGFVLKANPNYRVEYYPSEGAPGDRKAGLLKDAGKRLPLVKEVHIDIIREGVTSWNLFEQGYRDLSAVSQTNYQEVLGRAGQLSEQMKRKGIGIVRDVSPDVHYFAFNMSDPVVGGYSEKNRKLRQAISLAVDAQQFLDLLYQGMGKPAQSIVAPGLFGYDKSYLNPYRQPDLVRAKRLLAEAGYPDGVDPATGERFTLYFDNSLITPAGRLVTGLVVKQIEMLGIHVESRSTRGPIFAEKLDKGQFQFTYMDWLADYPDPENFVFLLYGPNQRPGPNTCNYENAAYDRLFEQMRSMPDGAERQIIINKMRDIAVEDCPWIYLVHPESFALTQPWLTGFKPNPVALDTIKYWRIDGAIRSADQHAWNEPNYWPALGFGLFVFLGSLPAASVIRRRTNRYVRRAK